MSNKKSGIPYILVLHTAAELEELTAGLYQRNHRDNQ